MALGDTLNQVDDATKGVQEGADGAVSKADPAKTDLQSQRKSNKNVKGEDDDDSNGKPSSLKIHIKLDLDVEVHLTARVKGDITIGLL